MYAFLSTDCCFGNIYGIRRDWRRKRVLNYQNSNLKVYTILRHQSIQAIPLMWNKWYQTKHERVDDFKHISRLATPWITRIIFYKNKIANVNLWNKLLNMKYVLLTISYTIFDTNIYPWLKVSLSISVTTLQILASLVV